MSNDEDYESVDEKFNVIKNKGDTVYFTPNEIVNGVKIKKENVKPEDINGDPKFSKNIRSKPKSLKDP